LDKSKKPGEKPKYLREIEKYRSLYEKKNLEFVRNKWIFYWIFLVYLIDIDNYILFLRDTKKHAIYTLRYFKENFEIFDALAASRHPYLRWQ